jgi:PHS family inorganic phosphate transporter-like MFS transporter
MNHVIEIFAFFMFLGIFTTLCIPETKRKTLEQLNGEEDYATAGTPQNETPEVTKEPEVEPKMA